VGETQAQTIGRQIKGVRSIASWKFGSMSYGNRPLETIAAHNAAGGFGGPGTDITR
jgi:hypothetical protein